VRLLDAEHNWVRVFLHPVSATDKAD
jgi:hypothetical protein